MTKIVLDPGHGGTAEVGGSSPHGTEGPEGLKEKVVTLQVGLAAEQALSRIGLNVSLTRKDDRNVGIKERAAIAKKARAAAFVSIHFNAPEKNKPPMQGTETWIGEGHSPISRNLAELVQEKVVAVTGYRDRKVRTGNVSGAIETVSHDKNTANCLVEISFLARQPEEERRLGDRAYVDALGRAIADAIVEHLRSRKLLEEGETRESALPSAQDAATARQLGLITDDEYVETAAEYAEGPDVLSSGPEAELPPGPTEDVPFIQPNVDPRPFSDLGGRPPVDDPAGMLGGWRKVRNEALPEAAVGRWLTVQASLLQNLAVARNAIARVKAQGVDYQGIKRPSPWSGTGFLVTENLFLTNHHVLNSREVAQTAVLEFDYEVGPKELLAGVRNPNPPKQTFRVDPQRLFITSPTAGGLDFTFVWIEQEGVKALGAIPMERSSFTVERGEQAFIIHHPRGRPKEASLDSTDVLQIQSTVIHYASDTDYGSSGSPVFDRQGRLIALHHARQPVDIELPSGGRTDVLNEEIKIAAIAIDLENRVNKRLPDASMAETVLKAIKGSDSLTGYFGGLGREVSAKTAVERVVDTYQGTDADVDVGLWNIEWLATRWRDPVKLQGAARVIADLNLDIWGLSEVSPPAVQALVKCLEQTFKEKYDCDFSEPDARDGRQTTAVIWKPATVKGRRVPWPDDIEPLLHLRSNDPQAREEAVHGYIFDRYPGLFHFELATRGPRFDFHLVPLHLKAMDEGSLRRRLASRILVRAVNALIASSGDADVILGGDVNAPLASKDFDALQDANFTPMSAADEQAGAITYIKSPKSLIDNIFLSPNLTATAGSTDYFIVAKERSVDDYVKRISDHRPVLVRISLAEAPSRAAVAVRETDVDALIDKLARESKAAAPRSYRP